MQAPRIKFCSNPWASEPGSYLGANELIDGRWLRLGQSGELSRFMARNFLMIKLNCWRVKVPLHRGPIKNFTTTPATRCESQGFMMLLHCLPYPSCFTSSTFSTSVHQQIEEEQLEWRPLPKMALKLNPNFIILMKLSCFDSILLIHSQSGWGEDDWRTEEFVWW